jgi:uncharacterized membrane protein YeaQ/YmgE (transglycosylase-associated protein family)
MPVSTACEMRVRKAGIRVSIVSWIAIGGLVGLVALRQARGRFPCGPLGAVLTGIAGGVVGGGVFAALDGRALAALDPITALSAFVGAVIVLAAVNVGDSTEPDPS